METASHKDTRHTFNVIFNSRHVEIENASSWDIYPVYWATEIIKGKAQFQPYISMEAKQSILKSASVVSISYCNAWGVLRIAASGSLNMTAYAKLSACAISNTIDSTMSI